MKVNHRVKEAPRERVCTLYRVQGLNLLYLFTFFKGCKGCKECNAGVHLHPLTGSKGGGAAPQQEKMRPLTPNLRNLAHRLPKPALGNGRLQRAAKRLFCVQSMITTR